MGEVIHLKSYNKELKMNIYFRNGSYYYFAGRKFYLDEHTDLFYWDNFEFFDGKYTEQELKK